MGTNTGPGADPDCLPAGEPGAQPAPCEWCRQGARGYWCGWCSVHCHRRATSWARLLQSHAEADLTIQFLPQNANPQQSPTSTWCRDCTSVACQLGNKAGAA